MALIDLNMLQAMHDAETNPARKMIYANHIRIAMEKQPICAACEVVEDEMVVPVNQSDEE